MPSRRREAEVPDIEEAPAAKAAKVLAAHLEPEPRHSQPHHAPRQANRRTQAGDEKSVAGTIKYRGRTIEVNGKKCKYCRSDATKVRWTKVDGLVCDACISSVKFYYKHLPKAEKESQLELVTKDDDEYKKYMTRRCFWLDVNQSEQRMTPAKLAAAGIEIPKARVMVKSGTRIKIVEVIGILWPQAAWIRMHGKPPDSNLMEPYKHKGKIVNGILKPESYGWEDGCVKIESESYEDAYIEDEIASAKTHASREQLQAVADKVITGASIEAKTSGSGEDIEMKLKRARFVAHSDDEDGAGGLSLLGCLEDSEEKVPTRKRGKQSVGSSRAPRRSR